MRIVDKIKMKLKLRTTPDISLNSTVHKQAIKDGDDHFRMWQRNVIDEFKELPNEEIKRKLQATAFPYAVCFENWLNEFNIASGIRNANAFNAKEVFYLGNKRIDRRALCGVHNYTEIQWLPIIDDFMNLKNRYTIIGIDNVPGAIPLDEFKFATNTLFVFGQEGVGLTPFMQSLCTNMVEISQFGSVRSINCATASGIVMHEFVRQFKTNT